MKYRSLLPSVALLLGLLSFALSAARAQDRVEVPVFTGEEFTFGERYEEVTVTLPQEDFNYIILYNQYVAGLAGERDPWDRIAATQIVLPGGEIIELSRDITDYGFTTQETRDITRFGPLLKGQVTFRMYLTTWTDGKWNVNSRILFRNDTWKRDRAEWVVPVSDMILHNNTADPGGEYTVSYNGITFPPGANRVDLHTYLTGHTQEEEFGPRRAINFTIDGMDMGTARPWRTDCDHCDNHGTTFNRSGWCPGAKVGFFNFLSRDPAITQAGDKNIAFTFDGLKASWEVSMVALGFNEPPPATPTPTPTPIFAATPTPTATPDTSQPAASVALAGYMGSDLSYDQPSTMTLMAVLGGGDPMAVRSVRLYYQGVGTEVTLDPLSPDVYQLVLPFMPMSFSRPTDLLLELAAEPGAGSLTSPWPYLTIK